MEDMIADRREYYNDSVTIYNIRIEQFPDVLIARLFNLYQPRPVADRPAHREDVEVRFQHM
ncbi:MAG: LemA family protein [Syntrophotaleaceae bacterium]